MKCLRLLWLAGFLFAVCGAAVAQQFHISSFTNGEVVIEYPPSFAGAYLFVESASNLTSNVVWEAVDYTQVELVEGDTVYYTPPATNAPGSTNQTTEVPYEITPEYIQAVSSGEIENDSWAAGTAWGSPMDGLANFYMISAISYVDTDGDGVDNVSEYGEGTDPNVPDSPPANLPPDDGDPKPVPGSVDSAPGDWNTPPQSDYRAFVGLHGAINARILAMDGTNGTFIADSTVAELGAWIETMCGTWTAPKQGDTYPTVADGRFFRTDTNGFSWAGMENIYPIAFYPYDGSEQFENHLIQSDIGDPAGLALLPDSTPVLVNAGNPWTDEKLLACLKHLVTVSCRLQRLNGGAFDPSDTTAMAQATTHYASGGSQATSDIIKPDYFLSYFIYSYIGEWIISTPSGSTGNNEFLTFLDSMERLGYGPAIHSGYIKLKPSTPWQATGVWHKSTLQPVFPNITEPDRIYKTFTCGTGDSAWLFAGTTKLSDFPLEGSSEVPPYIPPSSGYHYTGVFTDTALVLSTFSPPMSDAAALVMDFDRDGAIGTNDLDRVDQSHPFRFWVNEDGNNAAYPEADLEDFFSAQIHWREGTGISNLTFKLSANVDLDYIQTTMTTNDTDAYLTDLAVAGDLSQPAQINSLASGSQTSEAFAENTILLLAPSTADTSAEIYVQILENGSEILVSTNHFSFSPVADMYRTKNLRAGGSSSSDEPVNWPDELTNGKDFVFVHGYNVTESEGCEWNKNIFKRLWHSGSNAKYHAVLWDGTPPASGDRKHYHNAVVNAFATALDFAVYLNGLNEPVVAAHSLGNVVASSAICDHGANVAQYYLLNAAVAKEAYGDSAPNVDMIPDGSLIYNQDEGMFSLIGYDWREYPHETWASDWYRLFPTNDARSELTWRHRFVDIQDLTDAFNFYSSTEDILRMDTGYTSIVSGLLHGDFGLYAFQLQELFKGKNDAIANLAGGSDPYTGWGFTTESDTHIISTPLLDIDFWPRNPRFHHEQLDEADPATRAAFRETLKTDPLFRPEPAELFGAGAEAFAGATIATCGFTFNYDLPNATVDISDVPIRDYLLAKAFPARTGALGSRSNTKWDEDVNLDMSTEYMTDSAQWPHKDNDDNIEWRHSDFRDVPYVHIYQLFEKIVTKEN